MTDIAATAARLAAIEHTIADLTDEARTLRQMPARRRRGRRHHPEHRRHPCTVSHPAAAPSNRAVADTIRLDTPAKRAPDRSSTAPPSRN